MRAVLLVGGVFMGTRGPMPKRAEDRVRRNKEPEGSAREVRDVSELRVSVPSAEKWWSPSAQRLWRALRKDAKAGIGPRTNSDWAHAHFLMGELTRYQEGERQNGQVLTSLLSAFDNHEVSEGARRRNGVELSWGDSGVADRQVSKVTEMAFWQSRVGRGI